MDKQPDVKVLDTHFQDTSSVIAAYLIESDDGLILIETGPDTVFENLKTAIAGAGYDWRDVKHVLLTHIHFDHAGGAWEFAENGAQIYVHPKGLPHLNDPTKLWNSAKRIYKENMEQLWGKMKPIDQNLLTPVDEGDILSINTIEFKVLYTPGHAIHHNAYQLGNVIFTGDVAGVKIDNGPVQPPCPPPDIDIETWKASIEKLKNSDPEKLYLAHFGPVAQPQDHLTQLEKLLQDWKDWMKPYFEQNTPAGEITPKFVEYTKNQLKKAGVSEAETLDRYDKGNPTYMSVTGLLRYWKLKTEGRL